VTDLKMPGTGGVELVERLRDRYPRLAVVFTSGYAEAAAFSPEQLSGASAFVEKPFSTDELARAIRAVLDSRKSLGGERIGGPDAGLQR
jgi:FixJ family two-component response regulator